MLHHKPRKWRIPANEAAYFHLHPDERPVPVSPPLDLTIFDDMAAQAPALAADRKTDDVKRQKATVAHVCKLDLTTADMKADGDRRRAEARKRAAREEKERTEAVVQKTHQNHEIRVDFEQHQDRISHKRAARLGSKPVPVFQHIPSAESLAKGFEAAIAAILAVLASLWHRALKLGAYLPKVEVLRPSQAGETQQHGASIPAKNEVSVTAKVPTPALTPTQREKEFDRTWNGSGSLRRSYDRYSDKNVFRAVVLAMQGNRAEYACALLDKASPQIVPYMNGEFGSGFERVKARFDGMVAKGLDPEHAAEKVMPALIRQAEEASVNPTPLPANDEKPTTPPSTIESGSGGSAPAPTTPSLSRPTGR